LTMAIETEETEDTALVDGFLNGDVSAFDALMRRYKDRVYVVVYRHLGNHEDAAEVAQEVFVKAYHGLHAYKGQAKVYTWLYSIAANLSRNKLRDQKRKGRNLGASLDALEEAAPGAGQTVAQESENPRRAAEKSELDAALRHCLDTLPETYRLAFVLRITEDLPYADIADSLDCPVGTVKSRLNQARSLLRTCLDKSGVM